MCGCVGYAEPDRQSMRRLRQAGHTLQPAQLSRGQVLFRSAGRGCLRTLRIAVVSEYYYPQLGGVTEHVHRPGNELARRGHEVTLIATRLVCTPRTVDGGEAPSERLFELAWLTRVLPC